MANLESRGRGAKVRLGALAFVLGGLCLATPAHAEPIDEASRTAARALGNSGVEAYQAGNYKEASEKLEQSYAIARVPSLGLWSARALRQLGYLVESANRYLETINLQIPQGDYEIQKQAQMDAQKELDALKPVIPKIIIQIEGARPEEVQVSVDGKPLAASLVSEPRLVNPGLHKVEGVRGSERVEASAMLTEGQKAAAILKFGGAAGGAGAPATSDEGGGTSTATFGIIALGVGGAGIVVGSVAGILALNKKSTIDDSPRCVNNRCSDQNLVDSYGTLRTVSTVGFIAGGVLAGVGVALLVSSGSGDEKPQTSLLVGPGSVSLRRSF
jgi:hypothetical protein